MIVVSDLTKSYDGTVPAIKGISLGIAKGEFAVLAASASRRCCAA